MAEKDQNRTFAQRTQAQYDKGRPQAEIGTSALDKSGASDRAKSANGKTEHKQPQRKKKKPKSKETR